MAAPLEAPGRPPRRIYHRQLAWEKTVFGNQLIAVHSETANQHAITSSGHCAWRRLASGIRETTEDAL